MGGTAAVVGIISTIVTAGGSAYKLHQAAEDRRDEKKRLKKQQQRQMQLHSEKEDALKGKQRAMFAASGVDVGQGSPLAVWEETEQKAEQERADILESYGYQADALGSSASRLDTTAAAEAGGTLLSGASAFATNPYIQGYFR